VTAESATLGVAKSGPPIRDWRYRVGQSAVAARLQPHRTPISAGAGDERSGRRVLSRQDGFAFQRTPFFRRFREENPLQKTWQALSLLYSAGSYEPWRQK